MSPWVVLRLIIGLVVLTELNTALFYPIFPELVKTYGVDAQTMQIPSYAVLLTFGLGLFCWAPLVAQWGRRPVALSGVFLFIVGSILTAIAPVYTAFLAGRLIQSFALSCGGVLSPVVPTDLFKGTDLRRAFAQISMVFSITPVVAQVLGGYVSSHYHHGLVFLGFAVAGAALWVLFYCYFPETKKNDVAAASVPAGYLSWFKGNVGILKDPVFVRNVLCLWLIFAGESLYVTVSHFALQLDFGVSAQNSGWFGALASGGLLLGAFTSFRLSNYLDLATTIRWGLSLCVLGSTFLVVGQLIDIPGPALWIAPMFIYLVGAGLVYPNAINAIMKHFVHQSTQAAALLSTTSSANGTIPA
ncbi:MAG: MFS transporter, partial [Pseudomonadota bacterium]